jgi:hypothetical protein
MKAVGVMLYTFGKAGSRKAKGGHDDDDEDDAHSE